MSRNTKRIWKGNLVTKEMTASALAFLLFVGLGGVLFSAAPQAADEPSKETPAATQPATDADKKAAEPDKKEDAKAAPAAAAGGSMSPIDRVNSTEKGKLKNPYTGDAKAIEEGHHLFLANSCNGCHGGTGGGGMCPPLTNQTWVYGSDDDTLFRLITLGSKDLQAHGYTRKGRENVVGPMPAYAEIIKKEDDVWKIIAWIRSIWRYGDKGRTW
jgi:mono/diheme cytochrome c family protein